MSRSRKHPRPEEVEAARHDPRLQRAIDQGQRDPEWRLRGRCLSVDPETFFPEPQFRETPHAALALCGSCTVQSDCLAWALDAADRNGVWGGTTPRERQAMAVVWHDAIPVA